MINQMEMNPMAQMGINQMNQMEMNQIGMNPLGMNNQMNPLDNNQINMNIQNIINQYEDKIKELEDKLRQKELEIMFLKQKLNINVPNNNLVNMNINQMNQNMIPSYNNQKDDINKEISLTTKTENAEFEIKCLTSDKMRALREKYKLKGLMTHEYKVLDEKRTLIENGIDNWGEIYIKSGGCHDVTFKDNSGQFINVTLSDDCPINIALAYYLYRKTNINISLLLLQNNLKLLFTYNASNLSVYDTTPISKIFIANPIPQIFVNL